MIPLVHIVARCSAAVAGCHWVWRFFRLLNMMHCVVVDVLVIMLGATAAWQCFLDVSDVI